MDIFKKKLSYNKGEITDRPNYLRLNIIQCSSDLHSAGRYIDQTYLYIN